MLAISVHYIRELRYFVVWLAGGGHQGVGYDGLDYVNSSLGSASSDVDVVVGTDQNTALQ